MSSSSPLSTPTLSPAMQVLLKKIAENVSAFRDLKIDEIAEVFKFADRQVFEPEALIVEEGKVGSYMYILIGGEAIVSKRTGPGRSAELRRLKPGECFGEMSVVDNEPRSASVTAATNATLVRLNAQALSVRPEIGVRIYRNIARGAIEKLRALELQMKGQLGTVVPTGPATESE